MALDESEFDTPVLNSIKSKFEESSITVKCL